MIEIIEDQPKDNQASSESFILCDQKQFVFQRPFQKILGFSPMFNNTCVVLAIKSHCVECVAHINSDGKIIRELIFKDSNFYSFAITSDREIVWVDVDRELLLAWNLQTYTLLEFPFKYLSSDVSDTHQLFVFPENKLLCVAEWGRNDSNYFRLTYFQYPLHSESQPVAEPYESQETWTYEYSVRRANINSMFVWFKSSQKQKIQFKTYELILQNNQFKGKYTHHNFMNPIRTGAVATQLSIGNIWQMIPNKYMIVSITDRPKVNSAYPNSIFVYESTTGVFRESRVQLQPAYRIKKIDWFSFGTTAMIRAFDHKEGKTLETPIYYIDNANQCISAKQTWKCSYLHKYTFPGNEPNMIVDAQYQNGNVQKIVSRSITVAETSQLYSNMMVQYIDDIEEDLLYGVIHQLVRMS